MIPTRVTQFPYEGLQHLFTPPGLPLIEKTERVPPTTSMVVRGAAGSGKSTLALAVAHSIATFTGGLVLYLITEASPSDIEFKAEVLGLGNNVVVRYDPAAPHAAGQVAVVHLLLEEPDASGKATEELHKLAIQEAYGLLQARGEDSGTPVRALVVDGLSLPEGRGESLTRSDLVAFLQAVEGQGVSPILVEECGEGASEQLTFAVDVVLQLSFEPDPETGALGRKLTVFKSRYSDSTPGPHDAVLDDGRPAVWPYAPSLDFGGDRAPCGFFMPAEIDKRTSVISINRGALILSHYDLHGQQVIRAWQRTPSLKRVTVQCGPTTIVDSASRTRLVPYVRGPAALAWAIHKAASEDHPGGIEFHRLSYLLARPRYASSLPGLLDALVRRGFVVCVHDASDGLKSIDPIADFTGPSGHHRLQDLIPPKRRDYRAASAWFAVPLLERPNSTEPKKCGEMLAVLDTARTQVAEGAIAAAHDALEGMQGPHEPGSLRARIDSTLLLARLGQTRKALAKLTLLENANLLDPLVDSALGWTFAEIGDEAAALRMALQGIDREPAIPALGLLWNALWVRYTTTMISLVLGTAGPPHPLQDPLIARALAGRGHLDQARLRLGRYGKLEGLPETLVQRLQADVSLESPESEHWREAESRYLTLEEDRGVPNLERADMTFNRGVIRERLGDREAAVECYRKAEELNPLLEMARDRLVALGIERPA